MTRPPHRWKAMGRCPRLSSTHPCRRRCPAGTGRSTTRSRPTVCTGRTTCSRHRREPGRCRRQSSSHPCRRRCLPSIGLRTTRSRPTAHKRRTTCSRHNWEEVVGTLRGCHSTCPPRHTAHLCTRYRPTNSQARSSCTCCTDSSRRTSAASTPGEHPRERNHPTKNRRVGHCTLTRPTSTRVQSRYTGHTPRSRRTFAVCSFRARCDTTLARGRTRRLCTRHRTTSIPVTMPRTCCTPCSRSTLAGDKTRRNRSIRRRRRHRASLCTLPSPRSSKVGKSSLDTCHQRMLHTS